MAPTAYRHSALLCSVLNPYTPYTPYTLITFCVVYLAKLCELSLIVPCYKRVFVVECHNR